MTAYSLAVQADVRKRMSPPNRQDVPQISKELGIHRSTLYQWQCWLEVLARLIGIN
jgi:transposase-like protein